MWLKKVRVVMGGDATANAVATQSGKYQQAIGGTAYSRGDGVRLPSGVSQLAGAAATRLRLWQRQWLSPRQAVGHYGQAVIARSATNMAAAVVSPRETCHAGALPNPTDLRHHDLLSLGAARKHSDYRQRVQATTSALASPANTAGLVAEHQLFEQDYWDRRLCANISASTGRQMPVLRQLR